MGLLGRIRDAMKKAKKGEAPFEYNDKGALAAERKRQQELKRIMDESNKSK